MEMQKQVDVVARLENSLLEEMKRGTFKGLSDETVLRVMFAYARGYLSGYGVEYGLVYDVLMKLYDDGISGILGLNKGE